MNIHDEGVALKAYLLAAGRWEALEWERVHAWIDRVLLHHAPTMSATAPPAAPVIEVVAPSEPAAT